MTYNLKTTPPSGKVFGQGNVYKSCTIPEFSAISLRVKAVLDEYEAAIMELEKEEKFLEACLKIRQGEIPLTKLCVASLPDYRSPGSMHYALQEDDHAILEIVIARVQQRVEDLRQTLSSTAGKLSQL